MMRRWCAWTALLLIIVGISDITSLAAQARSDGTSPPPLIVGSHGKGRLVDGVNAARAFNKYPKWIQLLSPPGFQYATQSLAQMVIEVSYWLNEKFGKQYRLEVGDISKKGGGPLAKHLGHQTGLDVDIAYISRSATSLGHRVSKFHNRFREKFVSGNSLSKNFDIPKNYLLLKHIVDHYSISQLFVSCEVKKALEHQAQGRDSIMMKKIAAVPYHEDHFHVRLACPEEQFWCKDSAPALDMNCKS